MPLTTTADLGHHNMNRNIVRFLMENSTKERIVAVSLSALSKSLNQTSIQKLRGAARHVVGICAARSPVT